MVNMGGYIVSTKTRPKIESLKKYFESKGALLLSKEYINNRTPLYFKCSICSSEHKILYDQIQRGANPNLLCSSCLKQQKYKTLSYKEIVREMEKTGAKVLTPPPINTHVRVDFKCSNCGEPHYIRYGDFRRGRNPNLLCPKCSRRRNANFHKAMQKPFKEERLLKWREEFRAKGSELLTSSYENNASYLEFKCSKCGNLHKIQISNYISGINPELLCSECLRGRILNPTGNFAKRKLIDSYWFNLVKDFFNIPKESRVIYSSHHIKPYSQYPELQTSILNGFPLTREEHYSNYKFYHNSDLGKEIINWDLSARLPYQNYKDFKYLDFNSVIFSEIIIDGNYNSRTLLDRKREYHSKGILYIPIFFEEVSYYKKSFIIYSMLRNRLAKSLGLDVYKYTGQSFTRYNTRKLEVKELSLKEERDFFNDTHIQGFVGSKVAYGLISEGKIVAAMSFGSPRSHKYVGTNNFELLRFSCSLNSSVPGAASKLFKHFIKMFDPNLIISYCDLRFSSLNPEETIYPKLGFNFEGITKPNYKYGHPEYNRLFSRQSFQKWKLEKKLEIYDASLSETQNMINNGYYKLYDCGNFKFVWTKDAKVNRNFL